MRDDAVGERRESADLAFAENLSDQFKIVRRVIGYVEQAPRRRRVLVLQGLRELWQQRGRARASRDQLLAAAGGEKGNNAARPPRAARGFVAKRNDGQSGVGPLWRDPKSKFHLAASRLE